jgi:hypothetical protein
MKEEPKSDAEEKEHSGAGGQAERHNRQEVAENNSPSGQSKPHGYVFVLTPIEITGIWNPELIPNHRLVRANQKQIAEIKEKISLFNSNPFFTKTSPYENEIERVPNTTQPGTTVSVLPLQPESWRYWAVEFDGINEKIFELGCACELIENEIELGFCFLSDISGGQGFIWNPFSLSTFFQNHNQPLRTKTLSQPDLTEIGRIFSLIQQLPQDFQHIGRALKRYDQIKWLPRHSEMAVIGLFSVIESLVSHAPKLTESADSLSHQLRTKIPMVMKRFHRNFLHPNYFPGIASEEQLWNKLYAFRSKIVHGEDTNLSGDLKQLQTLAAVIAFLRESSKKLLLLSLAEPEFMSGLKKC